VWEGRDPLLALPGETKVSCLSPPRVRHFLPPPCCRSGRQKCALCASSSSATTSTRGRRRRSPFPSFAISPLSCMAAVFYALLRFVTGEEEGKQEIRSVFPLFSPREKIPFGKKKRGFFRPRALQSRDRVATERGDCLGRFQLRRRSEWVSLPTSCSTCLSVSLRSSFPLCRSYLWQLCL